ncbi:tyrosine-type recombinase/integrase [Methanolobus sp. WCC5]|uniref:tyrosine-type recombinase/integrase n=1 Tax=Methanolobus sp. WCC5 TaxID=3125785 RepID=UPI00325607A8
MKYTELIEDATVIEWLDIINAKEGTRRSHLYGMQQYTEYTRMKPEELLEEAEEDMMAGKLPRRRRIKKHVVGFRAHLQNKGLAPLTVRRNVAVVSSFYKAFEIDFPQLPNNEKSIRPKKENTKTPTKEDVRDVLKVCNLKEAAIVLCGYSSGMGAAELCQVSVEDFKRGYDPETEITMLDMRREKVGHDFITFLSPEASMAVWRYLEFRNRNPKSSGKEYQLNLRRTTPDSPLFISSNVPREYLQIHDEELRRLTPRAIGMMYQRLSTKAGKDTSISEFNIIRSHNMRKLFNSILKNAGCDGDMVEYFMGHSLGATKDAYYRPDIAKLKEIYIRFVPHLIVSEEFELKEALKQKDDEHSMLIRKLDEQKEMNDRYEARIRALEIGLKGVTSK